MSKVSVLFVCLGNICRSPLAEGVFRHQVKEMQIEGLFQVDSCGTAAYHIGELPDERSVANAEKNGVAYTHRARQFKTSDFHNFDIILPMDDSNKRDIEALMPFDAKAKVFKMRHFDHFDHNADVPDPYYGGADGFQEVFEIVDRSNKGLINYLIEVYKLK